MRHIDLERLMFLCKVVRKEIALLMQSIQELQPLYDSKSDADIETLLPTNQRLSEAIELFAGRFSRLQDTAGDKLLEQLMRALKEPPLAQLAKLDRAEALGWLSSADLWLETRQLRNLLVHEYIDSPQLLIASVRTALDRSNLLVDTAETLITEVNKLSTQHPTS
jgi:hypothetical protein